MKGQRIPEILQWEPCQGNKGVVHSEESRLLRRGAWREPSYGRATRRGSGFRLRQVTRTRKTDVHHRDLWQNAKKLKQERKSFTAHQYSPVCSCSERMRKAQQNDQHVGGISVRSFKFQASMRTTPSPAPHACKAIPDPEPASTRLRFVRALLGGRTLVLHTKQVPADQLSCSDCSISNITASMRAKNGMTRCRRVTRGRARLGQLLSADR